MFCKRCGNELSDTDKFCTKCGTPAGEEGTPAVRPESFGDRLKSISGFKFSSVDFKNTLTRLYIIGAALNILTVIFWFVRVFSLKSNLIDNLSESVSISGVETGDAGVMWIFTFITVIVSLGSAFFCLLPILTNRVGTRDRMILPKIASIRALAWFVFMMLTFVILRSAVDNYGTTKSGLTFGGWIMLIICVANVIVTFMISSKTKRISMGAGK